MMEKSRNKDVFKNDPYSVIAEYLGDTSQPSDRNIDNAAKVIEDSYRLGEDEGDALRVCVELAPTVTSSTATLATMFDSEHPALPREWKEDSEACRSVLSMSGYIEIGLLRALQVQLGPHIAANSEIEKIQTVSQFVETLQER